MPLSADGKSRSSQNARKHGLTAQDLVIGPEDRQEFDELLTGLQRDISPQGVLQETLFDELVAAAWNLRRIRRMETGLCAGATTYQDLLNDDEIQRKLDRLARHESRIERTFHRTLKELKALQTNAALQAMITRRVRDSGPALASAIEISKRTQALNAASTLEPPVEAAELEVQTVELELEAVQLEWIAPDVAAATAAG